MERKRGPATGPPTSSKRRRGVVEREAPDALRGLHFTDSEGRRFVELTSLAKTVQKKRGDKALQGTWRRAGFDMQIPDIDGIRGLTFPSQKGHASHKIMPAADMHGFQAYVRELGLQVLNDNEELLKHVAAELGAADLTL